MIKKIIKKTEGKLINDENSPYLIYKYNKK